MKMFLLKFTFLFLLLAKPYTALAWTKNANDPSLQRTDGIYSPIFNSENNIRKKKAIDVSFGIAYQLNSLAHDGGNRVQEISWTNTSNGGVVGELTVNFTSKFWSRLNMDGFFMANNTGDGTANTSAGSGYSTGGANGEIKAVLGYDVFSFKSIDISTYGGLYYKGITNIVTPKNVSSLVETLNFVGGVYGIGLTHYTDRFITNLFAEGYIAKLMGNVSRGTTTQGTGDYSSSTPAVGFGVGLSTDILVSENLWIKPFGKFQMMFANDVSYNNATAQSSQGSGGFANFTAATFGVSVTWR